MNENSFLRPGERLDDLQRAGTKIIQNPRMFCFGMDAVLLCSFARVKPGELVLDLCSGNGVIPILMDARLQDGQSTVKQGMSAEQEQAAGLQCPTRGRGQLTFADAPVQFTGLEINSANVDMARRSAELNGQSERVHFLEGDVKRADELLAPASFDAVTVNPPYMTGGHGLTGDNIARAAARHELLCSLDDVVAAAARALRPMGRLYMVHRPFRLADIFRSLEKFHLEPKRMRMVCPFAGREPNMVLIEAVRGGKPRLSVEGDLVIYESEGVYTGEVRSLYG